MRKKEIKGIVNDLLDLLSWKNPLQDVFIREKVIFNLISGEYNPVEKYGVVELLKEKREWFLERVKKLNGKLEDFEEAIIFVFGRKERVKIIYKGNKFEEEVVY